MFTLREINPSGVVTNYSLGDQYTFVGRFEASEEFRNIFNAHFERLHVADLDETADAITRNCYGFVTTVQMSIFPIFKGNTYYIMTESGKTFAKIRT